MITEGNVIQDMSVRDWEGPGTRKNQDVTVPAALTYGVMWEAAPLGSSAEMKYATASMSAPTY